MKCTCRAWTVAKPLVVKLLLLLAVSGSFTPAAQARLVGKIRNIRPVVETRFGTNSPWKRAAERTNIDPGQYIRSGLLGRATLRFTDGTHVILNSRTQVFIEGNNTPAKPLGLRIFGAFSQIVVRNRGAMPIRAAAAIAAPRGTEYMITLTDDDTMVLTVREGSVRFYNAQGEQTVNANQQSTARTGQAPTPPVAVDASGLMQWAFDVSALPVEFELGEAVGNVATWQTRAEANPNDASIQRSLGSALLASGDANAAVAAYQRAVQLDPVDTSRVGLAVAQLARHDLEAARNTLSANPTTALELAARGLVQLRSNDADAALLTLREATERDPRSSQALSLLTLAHLTKNEIAQATEVGRRAVQAAPNSSQAQASLSLALFYNGQNREASRAASRAVQLNPDSPLALLVHGQALLAGQQTDEARAALQQAEGLAPDLPIIQSNLAAAYVRLDMPQRAERAYRRVIDKTPNSAAARAGLGGVLISMGRRAEALAELERALQLDPENVPARANMALYHIEMGDFAAAQRIATTIGDDAASGVLYIRLSEASLFQQKLFEAQEYARRAVKLLPDSAPAHYQLGRVYREQDRNVQAEQEFRQAVSLDRQFAAARFALGLAQEAAASGRDLTRPTSVVASNSSGPRQALTIQNVQTPGVENRIQAAIQDPSVIRSASRAFGDNQVEGRLGTDDINNVEVSHLHEINNRRGALGLNATRFQTDSVRRDAEITQEKLGFTWGSKIPNNPSGAFALLSWDRTQGGGDETFNSIPLFATRRYKIEVPFALAGFHLQRKADQRTRFLLALDRPESRLTDLVGFQNTDGRSWHGEVRHDRRLNTQSDLVAGLVLGRRNFGNDFLFTAPPPLPGDPPVPDFRTQLQTIVKLTQLYLRHEYQPARKLRLLSEISLERQETDNTVNSISPPVPPVTSSRQLTKGLPKFVAEYQASRRDLLRFRAHSRLGTLRDFLLLTPVDAFQSDSREELQPGLGSGFRSVEAEWTHTFANASLLLINIGKHSSDATVSGAEPIQSAHFRRVQARYEGILNPEITYFVSGDLTKARGTLDLTPFGPIITNYRPSFLPRHTVSFGAQYLNAAGWFLQPSYSYISSVEKELSDPNLSRPRQDGFGLMNLRIGKRNGLRSSIFVEAANLFNKRYARPGGIGGNLATGRQVSLGFATRF